MVFNSLSFAIFFPLVLGAYYLIDRKAQNLWLLAASCVFYGWWDARFLLLLAFSTVVDFYCAQRIAASTAERTRKRFLQASLISNLTILGFFKYFNFFVTSADDALHALGVNAWSPVLRIVLPVGISFYTFQAMSYTIDVYRRHIPPCRSFATFALSVCYFPHLVAGPIQRASYLLPQLESERRVRWVNIQEGITLIAVGLFKKVGVADAVAPLVDLRFATPQLYGWSDLLLAVYLFAIQIYCDFAGYSDIARGVSKCFGIELMLNFDHPYFSTSITEFWRRWHISLSTWLREYLYIPLGGNRGGVVKTYRNLMLTMLLGGLWHGANWTFVIWGGLHGAYLAGHKVLLARRSLLASSRRVPEPATVAAFASVSGAPVSMSQSDGYSTTPAIATPERPAWRTWLTSAVKALVTFHLVCLAWIFFRADSLSLAARYLERLISFAPAGELETLNWLGARTTILLAGLLCIELPQRFTGRQTVFAEWHWSARALVYSALIVVILVCGGVDANVPFIYFQF